MWEVDREWTRKRRYYGSQNINPLNTSLQWLLLQQAGVGECCADTGISSDFLISIQEVRQPHYLFMLCYILINQSLHHLGH